MNSVESLWEDIFRIIGWYIQTLALLSLMLESESDVLV